MTHQILHSVYSLVISHFLLVWLLFLVFIVVGGLLLSHWSDPVFSGVSKHADSTRGKSFWRQISPTDGLSAAALLLFVAFYVSMILFKEDFAYYDDDMLTCFSVQGRSFSPPIWPSQGRFYPLADQEFNLLRFITRSPTGYHLFVALQLLVLLVVLFLIFRESEIRFRTLIVIAAMLAPSFVIPFTGFVYPERNVLFWLAILLLCLQGYSQTKARAYFIGCLAATHFALYYKEVVVLLVVAYAATRMLLQLDLRRRASDWTWQGFAKENSLSLGMLAVSSIYVVLFLSAMLPHRNFSYIAAHREALSSVLFAYFQTDWLPPILLAIAIMRFGRFLFSGAQLDAMWDSLAAGALAYFVAIVALRLNSGYYLAPVDLIALLYLANLSLIWLSKPTKVRVSIVATVFVCVLLHDAVYSTFRMVERKTVITTKSEFAGFLKGYLPTANSRTVELYFPYADGFHLMELSAYLRYKGFQLVGQSPALPETGPTLAIEGRENFTNNQCVDYRDFVCIHKESPGIGGLIVILPDDIASMNDVANLGKDSTLLFSLKAPGICDMKSFRSLHAISPEFSTNQLPGHWLQLHVFKKTLPLSISSLGQSTLLGTSGEDVVSLQTR